MIAVDVPPGLRDLFFPGDLWARLSTLGPLTDRLTADTTIAVTSWSSRPVDAETLASAPRLGLVAHTGATLRPYATDAAWDHGVRFTQAGAAMAHAVAEQALALTLALLHRVHRFDHALRTGVAWEAAKQAPPRREL
ncbi:MAG: hypothetical protein HOV71_12785, partial [Hamadaea sp.]|nr:hypothetical protein [Hamadaea sp.]